jgi:uncharacterized protein YcbX
MPITVSRIYRYPVKSMLGEDLESVAINARGVLGDRAYAVIDPAENRVGSAKIPHKWKRLYEFSALYPPGDDMTLPPPLVLFPDGIPAVATDAGIDARLSQALGKPVRMVSEKPEGLMLEAVKPGLDAVDLEETVDYPLVNPFFDFAAVHLVTSATLAQMRSLYPGGDYDARRFRPNLVLDAGAEPGFLEETWLGKTIAVGPAVRLRVFKTTHRCAATTLPHHGLPNDPEILRAANRHNDGNVGVYATVEAPGMIRVGDTVELT